MADQASSVGEYAARLGRTVGLFFDWASATRMGRLRGAGLLGALGAVVAWWADLHVLGPHAQARCWAVVGVLAVPLLAMGYWQVGEALRGAVPRAAALVFLGGCYGVGIGAALHALVVSTPPAAASELVRPLVGALAVAVVGSSLVFSWAIVAKPTDYPRVMVLASPATLTLAFWLVSRRVPGWEESGAFVAPLAAHLVFFLLSVVLIEWRNPERWG